MIAQSAVRPLRTAVLDALKDNVPTVGGRVYTAPVKPGADLPYLVISNYRAEARNFFGRPGWQVTFDLKGFVVLQAGDADLLALYEAAQEALHGVSMDVDGHLFLTGTLQLLGTYADPGDKSVWQFVARYTGDTRNERA